MAREDVNIKVSANVAEAIRLWKAMEQGPKGMANELDALGQKGKQAATGMGAEFTKIAGQWVSVGAAIAGAKQVLDAYISAQRESLSLERESTRESDRMSRELYNLADGKKPLAQIRNDFLNLAQTRKVAPGQAKDAIAALLGAGYTYEQTVDQGGADAVLRTLSATNATGKEINVKELTDALTAHLAATGQQPTKENILGAGQAIQAMFAATKLEMVDLQQFAPRAANIFNTTGLGNEQIAIASQLKDVTSAEVGATTFQSAVMRLQAGATNSRIRKALKELGVNPEDVDFQGESFFDVQSRMGAAFDAAGPKAANLKQRIFGNEGLLAGNVLFSTEGAAQTQERLRMMRDGTAFNRAAAVTEGGLLGKSNAADAAEMLVNSVDGLIDPEIARKNMMTELKRSGVGPFGRKMSGASFDLRLGLTGDVESALTAGMTPAFSPRSEKTTQAIQQVIDQSRAETIKIQLTDQNGVAIPHKSDVQSVPQNKAPKER